MYLYITKIRNGWLLDSSGEPHVYFPTLATLLDYMRETYEDGGFVV